MNIYNLSYLLKTRRYPIYIQIIETLKILSVPLRQNALDAVYQYKHLLNDRPIYMFALNSIVLKCESNTSRIA